MIYSPWWHHSNLIKYNLSVIYSENPSKIYSVEKYYYNIQDMEET